jgi:hypothetical protein
LLPLANLRQRLGSVDVGHRPWHLVAELPGGILPSLGAHALRLGEQGGEDLRLLVTEAGQGVQSRVERGAVRDVAPEVLGGAVVLVGEHRAHLVDSAPHRRRESVDRRFGRAHRHELVDVHRRDLRRVEVAESLVELGGTGERPLHRDLLVEQHAEEECCAVGVEQPVGSRVTGDVERA